MVRQTMFNVGEVDVINWKRTDIDAYLSCAQSLLNMEVGTTGLAKKRKGTRFLINYEDDTGHTVDAHAQMYEFIDKNDNYYLIVSGDSSQGWDVFTADSTTGNLTFLQNISGTPYQTNELPDIDYTQDGDVLVLAHPSYAPARIYISNYAGPTFAWAYLDIFPIPAFDFGTFNYSNLAVVFTNPTATTFRLVLTGAAAVNFTTAWVGGVVISAGNTAEQPIGYGIITGVTPGNPCTIDGDVFTKFAAAASMPLRGSQYSIRQPAWSTALGQPSKTAFYQNRLWFANTAQLPGTIFGSNINKPVSFDVGTGAPTDAIVYSLGQSGAGDILWLNGGKQLEIFSENFDFAAPQNEDVGITPGSFSIRQQSSYGSSPNIKPLGYINDSYFISKTGNAIINFHFNGVGLTYVSSNVSLPSQHLVKQPINRALLRGTDQSQDNFIYYLNNDYTITAFQFAFEYKLAALTPVKFADNILTNDICTVNNRVYMLKHFFLSGIDVIDVFDDSVRIDSYQIFTMLVDGTITGLDEYEQYTVQVVYVDPLTGVPQDLGQHEVIGGTVVADNQNGYSGNVQVGFLYDVEIKPMYLYAGKLQSAYYKNITSIYVDYVNSLNFYINGNLVPYQDFTFEITPKTDTAVVRPQDGWSRYGTINITQSAPFDLIITGIAYQIDAQII